MIYQFDSRVRYSEVDENRRITLLSILNYFQDCSSFHSEKIGFADDLYIGRINQTAAAGKVSTCITTPVTAECYNFRSEFSIFYRHIASTSAKICLLEKPCRSIEPDGQATVQAPQP